MAVLFNKYENLIDYTWYDSTNVYYSECFDTTDNFKTLKIVFKQGRTYIYKDVDIHDYIMFKNDNSNGSSFSKFIKKYKGVRIEDSDLNLLNDKMNKLISEEQELDEKTRELDYKLIMDKTTNEFTLERKGKQIFYGVENQVSVTRLMKSLGISFGLELTENVSERKPSID